MKLNPKLPTGEANGLEAIAAQLVQNPEGKHVVMAIVDCHRITTDADTGNSEPTARLRRVEVLLPQDRNVAQDLMQRALEHRTGKAVLPFALQQELTDLFDGVDPHTGRILDGSEGDDQ